MGEARQAGGEAPPVVSVAEAARRLGRSVDGVRGLIRRGRLTARRGNSGQLLVELPPGAAEAATGDGEAGDGSDEVAATLAMLREELEDTRDGLERWRQTAEEARAAAAAAAAEVRGRDALIEELRGSVTRERDRGDRLAAELAQMRRPWVARLVEAVRGPRP
jgi:hypothetical protein